MPGRVPHCFPTHPVGLRRTMKPYPQASLAQVKFASLELFAMGNEEMCR